MEDLVWSEVKRILHITLAIPIDDESVSIASQPSPRGDLRSPEPLVRRHPDVQTMSPNTRNDVPCATGHMGNG